MDYILSGKQMSRADRYTIETLGVPSLNLMERAAEGCVQVMTEKNLDLSAPCVVCGSGNNGGDGFAIARILLKQGYQPVVCMVGNKDHCSKETETQMTALTDRGVRILDGYVPGKYSIVIDAVFGVGLNREITGTYQDVIRQMNASSGLKFAVDVPSGISADSGMVLGTAFRADITVTFQKKKTGLMLSPGRSYAGSVIPWEIRISTDPVCHEGIYLMDRKDYQAMLPVRSEDSHKGTFGKLLIIAGSKGMSGAAYLNAMAAYLSGAGLVQIYTEETNREILQTLAPEAIVSTYRSYEQQKLLELLSWADAVCIGSGIGTSEVSAKILKSTLEKGKGPFVIDADGLNLLAEHPEYQEFLAGKTAILTPHMKEMSRLLGSSISELQKNRVDVLRSFTENHAVTCILKDARTLIGVPGFGLVLNTTGNAAMAKGGSGDVLAGILAGLLVQQKDSKSAACLGTYLHGRCGDLARKEKGPYSVLARDLLEHIGPAFGELIEYRSKEKEEWI